MSKFQNILTAMSLAFVLVACESVPNTDYTLQREDIVLLQNSYAVFEGETLEIEVEDFSEFGVEYRWSVDGQSLSTTSSFEHKFTELGSFVVILTASQSAISYDYEVSVEVTKAPYILSEDDIALELSAEEVTIGDTLKINVLSTSDEGVNYQWFLGEEIISTTKSFSYVSEVVGEQIFKLVASQGDQRFAYWATVNFVYPVIDEPDDSVSAYITNVYDFFPAVGQHVNMLPAYEDGDTQETMNQKVLDAIGGDNMGMISLGSYGGYVTVGFDHTIVNKNGLCDFRVYGNAFYAEDNPNSTAPLGGSCEPGIIMVAYDENKNGVADDNEWCEIAGSSHRDVTTEAWYDRAKANGNDVNFYSDYEITYFRESKDADYVEWTDNKGESGKQFVGNDYAPKFPAWINENSVTFKGSRLPQNGINEAPDTPVGNYVLYKFGYGYADNGLNSSKDSAIDISWAVDSEGNSVHLVGVDFIKIYSGVNQRNGQLGECGVDVSGVADLHILGEEIDSSFGFADF